MLKVATVAMEWLLFVVKNSYLTVDLPVATGVYGLDPIHFGIVLCLNLTLGLVTPPVGTGLFTASLLTGIRAERLAALLVPFLAVAFLVILLIIVWPEVTLALARWL